MNRKAVKSAALPEGWREVKLGDIADIKGGKRLPKGRTLVDNNTGYPYIRVTDMYDGGVDTRNIKFIPTDIAPSIKRYKIYKDDLFITVAGTLGLVGQIPITLNGANLTENANRLTNIKLDKKYLLYYLQSPFIQQSIHAAKTTNAQPKLAIERIKNFRVTIPTTHEQKAIASLLQTWDTAIEKTEALIAAKQKQFKWLLKTLISNQQDNPDWRKVRLGEVLGNQLMIKKGKMLTKEQMNKGNYPVVAGGQTYAAYHNKYTHDMKTITISSSGAYAGFVWFHDYPIFATDCNVITVTSGVIEYFYYAIKTQQSRLYGLQSGGAQPHIYAKDIAVLDVVIPPIKRQNKIAYTLKSAQHEIDLIQQLSKKYHTQKRGLMQKLLTGEYRVVTNQTGH